MGKEDGIGDAMDADDFVSAEQVSNNRRKRDVETAQAAANESPAATEYESILGKIDDFIRVKHSGDSFDLLELLAFHFETIMGDEDPVTAHLSRRVDDSEPVLG